MRRRLPHHHVAEQRRRGRQVAGDRGEVERRDRQHEALERAVLEPVPRAGRGARLLGEQPPREVHVVPPEVDQLAGGVDLGLVHGLGLAEHRRGVDGRPPRPGEQVGGAQEDRGAVVEGQLAPPGRRRPAASIAAVTSSSVALPSSPSTCRWLCGWTTSTRSPPPIRCSPPMVMVSSARSPARSLSLALQHAALLAARGVEPDRLVGGNRNVGDGIHRGSLPALARQLISSRPDPRSATVQALSSHETRAARFSRSGAAVPGWRTTGVRVLRRRPR